MVNHPEFGWLAFGGNVRKEGSTVDVIPLDSSRQRVYLASLGLWLTLDAGTFEQLDIDSKTGRVRLALAPATQFTLVALLRLEQPVKLAGVGTYHPAKKLESRRNAWVVSLGPERRWVELTAD